VLNAVSLSLKDPDLILAESVYPPPTYVRNVRRRLKRPLLLAIMGDHTLHFLVTGRYSSYAGWGIKRTLRAYDVIICYSDQQERLIKEVLGENARYRRISAGLPEATHNELAQIRPTFSEERILLVGSAPNSQRAWYKGIDLFQSTIERTRIHHPNVRAAVVGALEKDLEQSLHDSDIETPGQLDRAQLNAQYAASSVYLHMARGDAFPLSVLEAMSAGLPTIASNLTGTSEVVARVADWMVIENTADAGAEALCRLLALPGDERRSLGEQARAVSRQCTTERAVEDLRREIDALRATTPSASSRR